MTIRRIRPEDWELVKSLRLVALEDAPYAFIETLDEARKMPDSEWKERARRNAEGKDSTCVLAFDGSKPVGMAVGLLDEKDQSAAYIVAVWVAPRQRGSETARALVEEVAFWAREAGAEALIAGLVKGNNRAAAFFRKSGFHEAARRHSPPDFICSCDLVLEKNLSSS